MNRKLHKYNLKYQYLKLEEDDIRNELESYIDDFEGRFNKYYAKRNKLDAEERIVWVNDETGEVRDTPPTNDEFRKYREQQDRLLEKKREELKNKPEKLKKLYKKLSANVHPDRGGSHEEFVRVRKSFESNNLLDLLAMADEFNIDYEIDETDEMILEKNIKQLEFEIHRMKSTLAWEWGRGDKKGVVKEVERQTKLKVDESDLPDDLKSKSDDPLLLDM